MGIDLNSLRQATETGPVARILVADHKGSAPRESGTSMLVTATDCIGTIGGGALELRAIERARIVLADGVSRIDRYPLGPALGQCCGGAVVLVTERFDKNCIPKIDNAYIRRVEGDAQQPLALARDMRDARNGQSMARTRLVDGWLIEPIAHPRRKLWLYGAGHVGPHRATICALVVQ